MANIEINKDAKLTVDMEELTTSTPAHANEFNKRHKQLLENDWAMEKKIENLESLGQTIGVVPQHADLPLTIKAAQSKFGKTPTINDYADVQKDENNDNLPDAYSIVGIDEDGNITWSDLPFRSYSFLPRDFTVDPIQTGEVADNAVTDAKIGNRSLADIAASATLLPTAAKSITQWLQGQWTVY